MIHSVRFKNYYSFGIDEGERWAEIDFRVADDAADGGFIFRSPSGQLLNRVLVAVGANASGKTNLVRVIPFLVDFMLLSHSRMAPGAAIAIKSHLFEESEIVWFEMTFELRDGRRLLYHLQVTRERVVRESLRQVDRPDGQPDRSIVERVWRPERGDYDFTAADDLGYVPTKSLPLRDNVSVLSCARQNEGPLIKKIEEVFDLSLIGVSIWGNFPARYHPPQKLLRVFKEHPFELEKFNKVVKLFDLGLNHFKVVEREVFLESGEKEKILVPVGVHIHSGREKELDYFNESSGTKALFALMPMLLAKLDFGGVSAWDELEKDLHPDMILAIVRLFLQSETNPNNAQILFSSHNHEVLRLLGPSQVILLEKEEGVFSVARRLDTLEGVTGDESIYARYRSRAYGAKPDLHLDRAVIRFLKAQEDGRQK